MNREIKQLLSKEALTGEEVGRLMLLDLLEAYKSLMSGKDGAGVLTDAQKIDIVDSLTMSDDIKRFNDYRGVHDFLTTVSAIYESYAKTYEVYYWKLLNVLMSLKYAEEENNLSLRRPLIMTKERYELFVKSGEEAPVSGIAMMASEPAATAANENGLYNETLSALRRDYMAEAVLRRHSDLIRECMDGMKDMLAECVSRRKAMELIARFIKIPYVKNLVSPVNDANITAFNAFVSDVIMSVSRRESHSPEYENELREKLSAILTPIDLTALEPTAQSVSSAKKLLSFSVIKNGSEAFIALLKREWRNG